MKFWRKIKQKEIDLQLTEFPGASSEGQGALAMPAFFIPLHRSAITLLMELMDCIYPFSSLVEIPVYHWDTSAAPLCVCLLF
jgi:hypothetical protein